MLADGHKLQHTASASLDVERPNKLRLRMHSARSERELCFDGRAVTLYNAGCIVGGNGGNGTLKFNGKQYPLSIGGVSLGATQVESKAQLEGRG